MPALKGIEIKTLFGKTVDKENESVFFNDAEHLYLDKLSGEKYIIIQIHLIQHFLVNIKH